MFGEPCLQAYQRQDPVQRRHAFARSWSPRAGRSPHALRWSGRNFECLNLCLQSRSSSKDATQGVERQVSPPTVQPPFDLVFLAHNRKGDFLGRANPLATWASDKLQACRSHLLQSSADQLEGVPFTQTCGGGGGVPRPRELKSRLNMRIVVVSKFYSCQQTQTP